MKLKLNMLKGYVGRERNAWPSPSCLSYPTWDLRHWRAETICPPCVWSNSWKHEIQLFWDTKCWGHLLCGNIKLDHMGSNWRRWMFWNVFILFVSCLIRVWLCIGFLVGRISFRRTLKVLQYCLQALMLLLRSLMPSWSPYPCVWSVLIFSFSSVEVLSFPLLPQCC